MLMVFFKYSNRSMELNKYPYLNLNSNILNFKNSQTLDVTSHWSLKGIYEFLAFIKLSSYLNWPRKNKCIKEIEKENRKEGLTWLAA